MNKRLRSLVCLFLLMIIILPCVNIKAKTVDTEAVTQEIPVITAGYTVLNRTATINYSVVSTSDIVSVRYIRGKCTSISSTKWDLKSKDITKVTSFKVKKAGNYSIMAENKDGHKSVIVIKIVLEFRAVWIAYYELWNSKLNRAMTELEFTDYIGDMFDNAVAKNMNAVVVHVRPFCDAMYKSKYYPWSKYASGTQGVSPGYDPLKIMVEEAHRRKLDFHAWLNPYRISSSSSDIKTLSEKNPARKWLEDDNPDNDNNVIAYNNRLYLNPSSSSVRKLIVNGIKEIVRNYDVDGIHFDDYFYPDWLGTEYATVFDSQDYEKYVSDCIKNNKKYKTIENWRRNNVNTLIKSIYKAVKSIDSSVIFGISPGGFIDYLIDDTRYYVDFPTWMASTKYIDYICPQLYWGFDTANKFPFDITLDRWINYRTSPTVKIYAGIGSYKMNQASQVKEWLEQDILYNMVDYARNTKKVDGYIFFDYTSLVSEKNSEAVNKAVSLFN